MRAAGRRDQLLGQPVQRGTGVDHRPHRASGTRRRAGRAGRPTRRRCAPGPPRPARPRSPAAGRRRRAGRPPRRRRAPCRRHPRAAVCRSSSGDSPRSSPAPCRPGRRPRATSRATARIRGAGRRADAERRGGPARAGPTRRPRPAAGSPTMDRKTVGRSPRRARASRSITPRSAPTIGARSVLLITSRSAAVTPGPPLRGTLSPPATSTTKICRSTSPRLKVAVRLSPPLSTSTRSSGPTAVDQLVDGVQVGADVVADRGVRAAAGLHRPDPRRVEHAGPAQEVGVLGGVDVVGDHAQAQLTGEGPAQRRDQGGLARPDRPADADPQRPGRLGGSGACGSTPGSGMRCAARSRRAAGSARAADTRSTQRCQDAKRRTSQVAWTSAWMSVSGRGGGRQPLGWVGGGRRPPRPPWRRSRRPAPTSTACTWYGSSPSSRTAGAGRPGHRPVRGDRGRLGAVQPGGGGDQPEHQRLVRRRPVRRAGRRTGRPARGPARPAAGPGPAGGTPPAAPGRRSGRPARRPAGPASTRRSAGPPARPVRRRRERGARPARRWPAGRAGTRAAWPGR